MKLLSSLLSASCLADALTHSAPAEYCCGYGPSASLLAEEDRAATTTTFRLQVREQRLSKLRDVISQVSDPRSPSYGRYLSRDEVLAMTAPRPEDLRAVTDWLEEEGVDFRVEHGRTVVATTTVERAERLLTTTYHTLTTNEGAGASVLRCGDYTIPDHVDEVLSGRFGLHGVPVPGQEPLVGAGVAKVTPSVIEKTYNVSGVTPSGSSKNRQAVAEFQGQNEKDEDLADFFKEFVPNAQAGDEKVFKFVGDKDQQEAGAEASLDIQYIMGVAPHVLSEFWLWDPTDFCSDLVKWTNEILSQGADGPLVHSVSYGWQGDLKQVGCADSDVDTVDGNFQKITAQGISIIFASGDSGSGWTTGLFSKGHLYPSWPASSPYVTAVGATRFVDQEIGAEEMASDQFGSGGGFSAQFDQTNAPWQVQAVKAYTSNPPSDDKYPPQEYFNAHGRATPDVCALGEGYQVILNGRAQSIGGTSASTPAFAGLVSLLNDARLSKGMPPMGLLNPFLYQNADCFTDVTKGTNAISRSGLPSKYGFAAAPGWDPATGLGSPVFPKLLAAALKPNATTTVF